MAEIKMYGHQNNVLCYLFLKSTSVKKVLLVFFLLSLSFKIEAAEECDFVKCISGVRSYIFDLSRNLQTFTCKKLSNIKWCSEHCMHEYFPNAFSHLKEGQISFPSYCEENISNRLNANWTCIARHIYRLFTCLVNVNSLTANHVREDIVTVSCRKYLEFPNCPKQTLLADCGEESSGVVRDLILYVLDTYQAVSCKGANVKEVLAVPISYQLGRDFIDAASSLDNHHLIMHNCLNQLIQDKNDLETYMCGEYDPDISGCVNFALTKNGKAHPDLKRLLLKMIALSGFKCKHLNFEPIPVSTLHSSESQKMKPDDHYSLKDGVISNIQETATFKTIENENNLELASEVSTDPEAQTESKSEISIMKDSSNFNKNIKIINVSDSVKDNSKRQMDKNKNFTPLNLSCRINISVFTVIFYFVFLLFVFR